MIISSLIYETNNTTRSNFVNKSKVDDVFGMSNEYNEIK